jgi:hypothetical protein
LSSEAAAASTNGSHAGAVVLETFHAGTFELDLVIAKCRSSKCPIQVRLLRQGHVVDRIALPVPAYSRRAEAETVDTLWADPGLKAWATGAEEEYVSTAGRLVTPSSRTTGLLVSQQFGFQVVKRNHLFILPHNGKLAVVWKAEEGEGPTWSATQILRNPAREGQDILYFSGFYSSWAGKDTADEADAVRLSWDARSTSFREAPLPDRVTPLYLLNLGVYGAIAEAHDARESDDCLSPYWILDARRFPGLSGGKAVIGRLYVMRDAADAAARSIKECRSSLSVSVLELTEALK